jgi:hypothetical protein
MTDWISVEDDMPAYGDTVLVYSCWNVSVADYYEDWVGQCDGEDVYDYDHYKPTLNVTHWMPLPKSPEN